MPGRRTWTCFCRAPLLQLVQPCLAAGRHWLARVHILEGGLSQLLRQLVNLTLPCLVLLLHPVGRLGGGAVEQVEGGRGHVAHPQLVRRRRHLKHLVLPGWLRWSLIRFHRPRRLYGARGTHGKSGSHHTSPHCSTWRSHQT